MERRQELRSQSISLLLKVCEMTPGVYTVTSYESRKSKYGKTYIIHCDDISFWATSYLANYIIDFKPMKKFNIIIKDGKIDIPGYSRLVTLT